MTTRLRETAPCARAMSTRNAGAAKLTVNAATPPRMNSRRVTLVAISLPLDELILAGPGDKPRETGSLRVHLRVGAGPCPAGVEVREQFARLGAGKRCGSKPLQHGVEQAARLRTIGRAERAREIDRKSVV